MMENKVLNPTQQHFNPRRTGCHHVFMQSSQPCRRKQKQGSHLTPPFLSTTVTASDETALTRELSTRSIPLRLKRSARHGMPANDA